MMSIVHLLVLNVLFESHIDILFGQLFLNYRVFAEHPLGVNKFTQQEEIFNITAVVFKMLLILLKQLFQHNVRVYSILFHSPTLFRTILQIDLCHLLIRVPIYLKPEGEPSFKARINREKT